MLSPMMLMTTMIVGSVVNGRLDENVNSVAAAI